MKRNSNTTALFFLLPFIILVTAFYVTPAILTVIMSFTNLDMKFKWDFIGWTNYKRLIIDPNSQIIFKNTIIYVFCCLGLTILLALLFSTLTSYFIKSQTIGSIFRSILMIPMITPSVVFAVLTIWLLEGNEKGFFNRVIMSVGYHQPVNWVAEYPMATVIIATVISSVAFSTIVFSSAIESIPKNQILAARMDGASELEIVRAIIIPNILPQIKYIALWELLGFLTNFETILLITNGGPNVSSEVWSLSAYHRAFVDARYGYGAAFSVVLIAITIVLMGIFSLTNRFKQRVSKIE